MIGVFNSGHGGLTVLRALVARLPERAFIYLGAAPTLARSPSARRASDGFDAVSGRPRRLAVR